MTNDRDKPRERLLEELLELRQRTARTEEHEVARREAESWLRAIQRSSLDALLLVEGGRVLAANAVACRLFGFAEQQLVGRRADSLFAPDDPRRRDVFETDEPADGFVGEVNLHRADGSVLPAMVSTCGCDATRGRKRSSVVLRDLSEDLALRERLGRAERLEMVGRLVGGVVHEFNNLLTAIEGYSDLLLRALDEGDGRRVKVVRIREAGQRAATLTRQLLGLGSGRRSEPAVLDLRSIVTRSEELIRGFLGSTVTLEVRVADDPVLVCADEVDLEQTLINLVMNSRDAMPAGGDLEITVGRADDPSAAPTDPSPAGVSWARLVVRDTGHGMSPEVRARATEPFFTTKPRERGTGVGLAFVRDTVHRLHGHLDIRSQPGRGTSVEIRLRRATDARAETPPHRPSPAAGARGRREDEDRSGAEAGARGTGDREASQSTETILVVEDEDTVRSYTRDVLLGHGYRVLLASNVQQALEVCREPGCGAIDLVLIDLVLPGGSGTALASQIARERPEFRLLFTSGCAEFPDTETDAIAPDAPFLQKPYAPVELLGRVRDLLDSPERAADWIVRTEDEP